jgi:hypothetical protein
MPMSNLVKPHAQREGATPLPLAPRSPRSYADSPTFRRMRCACQRCGAHTVTNVGFVLAGNCSNCKSYELIPIEPG